MIQQQQEIMITQTSEIFDVEDLLYDFPQQEMQSSDLKVVTVVPSRSNLQLSKMATPTSQSSSAQSILINREEALYRQRQGTSFKPSMDQSVLAKSSQLQSEATTQFSRKSIIDVKETGMDSVRSYMKTMCRHELLNKNEEIILAREIQILARWEKHRNDLEANLLR
jgi:Sigma-70 factor, region 1.2